MPHTRPSTRTETHLVRVAMALDRDVDPERFLAAAAGGPRGYWGGPEGRWVAWRGSLRVLRAEAAGPREGEADRFRAMEAAAGEVLCLDRTEPPPRFFGGFSFREDHRAEGVWSAFPRAVFVLPAAELEWSGETLTLRVQALAPAGADPASVGRALEARMEELGSRLTGGDPAPAAPPAAPGAAQGGADGEPVLEPSSRDAFETGVHTILDAIREGRLRKAVLARVLDVSLPAAVDPAQLLGRLRRDNHSAHVFLFEPEPGSVLAGAAPEVVGSLLGSRFRATAVAGSIGRGRDSDEDEALGQRLLASVKDREEQDVTLREMIRVLESRLERPGGIEPEPHLLVLPRIQHLESRIEGRARPGETILGLVSALHPTPAVCGLPRDAALELLRGVEPFQRGWYAGPVGWFDAAGNGEFVPALRSAVGGGRHWRLLAGAGIVPGSAPGPEWEETAMKLQPALRALMNGAGP